MHRADQMQLHRAPLALLVAGLMLAALPTAAAQYETTATTASLPDDFADNDMPCLDLTGSIDQGGGVTLEWDAVAGAQDYTVYRISAESGDFEVRAVVDAANGTTYADALEAGVVYGYAVTVAGAMPYECEELLIVINDLGGCVHAGDCPPCPEPGATALPEGGVRIEWTADARVVEWAVLRATEPDGFFELAGLTEGNVTVFVDEDVEAGQTYYYLLAGLSDGGLAGFCEEPIAVTAVPFFGPGVLGVALAGVGAVGALVMMRRRV